jgi:hypothetical protein
MKQTNRILAVILFLFLLASYTNLNSQSWNALGTGVNGTINAAIVFNGQLIVAGNFSSPGSNIARWNGTAWQTLGTGTNGVVNALTIFNNVLIVGGAFNNVGNNIAAWNGTTWTSLGLGTNDTVYSLAVYANSLRAGGAFTTAGGVNCRRLALYTGTTWGSMPGNVNNGANNTVYALTVFGNDLICGGSFTSVANNQTANRIVRYNSNGTYTAMGSGIDNGQVNALGVFTNTLYVGGSFTTIGGSTVNNLGRWNGTNWNTVSTGTNGAVKSLWTRGSDIVIGGVFTTPGNAIATWNGTAFGTLGAGITGGGASVNALTVWLNVLVAGGNFTTAGTSFVPASNVAGWGSVPVAPTLISPPDGATGISITPTLDWSDVAGASTYGVQVSTNANFTNIINNQTGLAVSNYTVAPALNNSTTYFWRATAANGLGTSPFSLVRFFTTNLVGIINNQEIPVSFKLYQNYPNPFNPVTKIRFDLPANANPNSALKLTVYDISGKVVSELLNTSYTAGTWEMDFNASNLATGTYFCKIEAGDFTDIQKMVLVK